MGRVLWLITATTNHFLSGFTQHHFQLKTDYFSKDFSCFYKIMFLSYYNIRDRCRSQYIGCHIGISPYMFIFIARVIGLIRKWSARCIKCKTLASEDIRAAVCKLFCKHYDRVSSFKYKELSVIYTIVFNNFFNSIFRHPKCYCHVNEWHKLHNCNS